jgi:hypothetical protein
MRRSVRPPEQRGATAVMARPRRRVRRLVALAVLILLTPVLYSYVSYMVKPSNSGFFAQSVEWLRTHGGRWLVNDVENLYYSINAPSKGGPGLKKLPHVGFGAAAGARGYRPPAVVPPLRPPLPGEGVWRKASPNVAGAPAVLDTTFRTDPAYPRLVAGVAWIDHTRTRLALYPGRYEPPSAVARGSMAVPAAARAQLVATFNSGFKLEDSSGGFVAGGHVYAPLVDGKATLLAYRSGRVDVRTWVGPPNPGPDVVVARQNLPLIVDAGKPNPNLGGGPEWGATLGNKVRVWRSGIGVDRQGNLLYAAADQQTVASLADILRRAGAVRAMELDINYEWVSFNTYQWFGHDPSKLLPGMDRPPTRYLTPDDRDFFAVLALAGKH